MRIKFETNILFYHVIPIKEYLRSWKGRKSPGHIMYGLTHLEKYGIGSMFKDIPFNPYTNRIRLMFFVFINTIFSYRKYNMIYAVTFRGLELVILLRALGIFRKPIVVWHHTSVIIPKGRIRRLFSSLFYRGIDKMFFFSEELKKRSIETNKVKAENAIVIPWGADLDYYDKILLRKGKSEGFISTGAENRDFITLLKAFNDNRVSAFCNLFIREQTKQFINKAIDIDHLSSNICLNFGNWTLDECAYEVNNFSVVVIPCLNYPYTIGLTTLVEALALGKAVITTDNPTFPIDVEKEGIGIKVAYGDVEGWINAINYLANNPDVVREMGIKARCLAEQSYNLNLCSEKIALELLSMVEY